ncbi:YjcZ family sporulation protein [Lysinibacillus fusiformis]|nr:YjcZ family sporulation protein [Lysinibacillus fusiformis]
MGNQNYDNSSYGSGSGSKFALIVVLFILLIIVGASFMHRSY